MRSPKAFRAGNVNVQDRWNGTPLRDAWLTMATCCHAEAFSKPLGVSQANGTSFPLDPWQAKRRLRCIARMLRTPEQRGSRSGATLKSVIRLLAERADRLHKPSKRAGVHNVAVFHAGLRSPSGPVWQVSHVGVCFRWAPPHILAQRVSSFSPATLWTTGEFACWGVLCVRPI